MKPRSCSRLLLILGSLLAALVASGANPLVTNIFTADPTGRVFGDRLYVYTSHDEADATYWDMVDWRLLSTTDLKTWKDHGSIFRVKDFSWATRWAWAPDCVQANGKYYLFLPVDRTKIGVAVGDRPEGPFKDAIGKALLDNAVLPDAGAEPIDPAVLLDDDGQAYLYFGCRQAMVVKLKPSLTELAGPLQHVSLLDAQGIPFRKRLPARIPSCPRGTAKRLSCSSARGNTTSSIPPVGARNAPRSMRSATTPPGRSPMPEK
jgi:arabinoxylan arabinofuranohydrolase